MNVFILIPNGAFAGSIVGSTTMMGARGLSTSHHEDYETAVY